MGTLWWDAEKSPGGREGWGLTERGGQALAAQDFSVELFCLLVLVLFQVGRGLREGMAWMILVQIWELPRPSATSQHIWPHPYSASAYGRVGLASGPGTSGLGDPAQGPPWLSLGQCHLFVP